ncbi:hypothetical protein ASE68_03240 [Agromyces sp. Leaf222]|nr:hypothetical protein ASE68_03240 [Agromyces sp. Leaf222]
MLGIVAAAAVTVGSLLAISPPAPAEALDNGLADTPPMGWNSWNQFYCNGGNGLTAAALMNVADEIVEKGLQEVGYEYVVLDDCFQNGRDANGVLKVDPTRFPNGIKPVADYVHSKGLKFGIYSVPGTKTCANLYNGYTPNIGSYGHEQIDAETFAAWGVDYLKYDWCYPDGSLNLTKQQAFSKMRDELAKVDRDIVYAISEYGDSAPWTWAEPIANLWRTTGDIAPNWGSITSIIDRQAELHPYSGPGHWNDPDMLQFSNGSLTYAQNKSHLAMWSMLAAPLFLGTDIGALSDAEVALLTNKELVDIDQDPLGEQARRISNGDGLQVWTRELADGDLAVALLNTTGSSATVSTSLGALGAQDDVYVVRDVWSHSDLYNTAAAISATLPAYETAVYRLSAGMDEHLPGVVGASGSGRVEQSGSTTVPVTVHNLLEVPLVGSRLEIGTAGGVTAASPVSVPEIAAGGSATVTVDIEAGATATIGDVSLPAQIVWEGGSEPASVVVKVTPSAPTGETYLSDLPWLATTNGWTGTPRRDLSQDDHPLTVDGTVYPKGIGSNAVSTVDVWLGGNCTVLSGALGVDDETNNGNTTLKPSISGSVTGDGSTLWSNSSVIRYKQKEAFTIDVTGVDRLRLTADIGGDTNAYDHADWLTMSLSCADIEDPELSSAVSVETRCVAGKGVLAVRIDNENDVPVDIGIDTDYGTKSFADIASGKSGFQVFSTRQATVSGGNVSIVLSAEMNGRTVTTEKEVPYSGKSC